MKKLLIIICVLLLAAVGFATHRYISNDDSGYPNTVEYPSLLTDDEKNEIKDKHILIIGDRSAKGLYNHESELASYLKEKFSLKVQVGFIAGDQDNIHRTIKKLDELDKLPQIIIYHGGSSEFVEKTFDLASYKAIKRNIKRYENPKVQTATIIAPPLAKVIYDPVPRITHKEEITPYEMKLPNIQNHQYIELKYSLYRMLLSVLNQKVKEKKSRLILLTRPVNIGLPPNKTCNVTTTPEINKQLQVIKKQVEDGIYKDSMTSLQKLKKISLSNADVYYQIGLLHKEMGQYAKAKVSLYMATAYDCNPQQATHITNTLIRNFAKTSSVPMIDFDLMVGRQYGHNECFLLDSTPQNIFYQELIEKLGTEIKRQLTL